MVATRGWTSKRPWRRSCHSSKLKSSSAPIGRKDSWCFNAVGSSNAPLLGSTAAEGLQRIGRTSIATRWRSSGLPQSASCSENFVIPPDVFGQTLKSLVTSSIHYMLGDIGWADLRMRIGRLSKDSYYDYLTTLIMQRVEGSCGSVWIDVGAHEGEILREMLTNAPEAEFLAFEPIPKFYQILKQRFPGSNVRVFNMALSDHASDVSF